MYDAPKILTGILVFLAVFTSPLWYGWTIGQAEEPQIVVTAQAKELGQGKCVEDTKFMRANHMDLLNTWRDQVVRQGHRLYTAHDGKRHTMSLSNTCLKCHHNKAEFCDRCHNYQAVTPTCFNCHLNPGDYRR